MGKFMDSFRQHQRGIRKAKGRRAYIDSFPWHDGSSTQIVVTNALNPGQKHITNILTTEVGHKVGLMFELAGKPIVTEIECPVCKAPAKLNVHWPAFRCENDKMMWEQHKHEQQ